MDKGSTILRGSLFGLLHHFEFVCVGKGHRKQLFVELEAESEAAAVFVGVGLDVAAAVDLVAGVQVVDDRFLK